MLRLIVQFTYKNNNIFVCLFVSLSKALSPVLDQENMQKSPKFFLCTHCDAYLMWMYTSHHFMQCGE